MRPRQRGYLLIALLLTLVSLSAIYLTAALKQRETRADWRAQRETLRALHDAKVALISFGSMEDSTPGTLPRPADIYGKLDSSYQYKSAPPSARRFPWFFLGMQTTMDGNGDCLWYALDKNFSNLWNAKDRPAGGAAINPGSSGSLTLSDSPLPVAAVLISSGHALSGQQRGAATTATCASGTSDQFLESSNAATTGAFVNNISSETFNDTVQGISHVQLLKPVLKRVLHALSAPSMRAEIVNRINAQPAGGSAGTLASLRGTDAAAYESFDGVLIQPSLSVLYYPSTCAGLQDGSGSTDYKQPVSWLCFNDWYSYISFQRDGSPQTLSVALAPSSTYHCTMALDSGQISCAN